MFKQILRFFTNQNTKDLYRYSKESNICFIDIEIDFYRELYNEWDFSPITNRDLDIELFEFLEASVEDIPNKFNIAIVFNIPTHLKDEEKEQKSVQGFLNYFNYEIRKQNNKIRKSAKSAISSGIFGMLFLLIGTWVTDFFNTHTAFTHLSFLAEGFVIGGWVLIWELVTIIFFNSKDLSAQKKILERLRDAKIEFNYR